MEQAFTFIERAVSHDALTGARNRRWLDEALLACIPSALREDRPLALLMGTAGGIRPNTPIFLLPLALACCWRGRCHAGGCCSASGWP